MLLYVSYYKAIFCGLQFIDYKCFTCIILSALVVAGAIAPLVRFLYKPSTVYHGHKKRTIQNAIRNAELSMLVTVYSQENVPTILNILEASNPTRESPVVIYLLHLIELVGRAAPLLIAHKPHDKFDKSTSSDHIINRFRIYEKQNQGVVVVQPFTAMTPLVTAHDDVCTLAFQKRTFFIIIPFHKQWNIDGTTQSSKWRNTNKKILAKAPCSVGILIDRGGLSGATTILSSWSSYTIGVIFLGGPDDREALFYGMRMANHPKVNLIVHRLIPINNMINNVIEKRVDGDVINEYRLGTRGNQRSLYKEHVVKDGVEIVSLMRTMQSGYHLILVGRHHDNYSALLSALTEWSEYPELGFFGDMFATSDIQSNISVLVTQQHSSSSTDEDPGIVGEAHNYSQNKF